MLLRAFPPASISEGVLQLSWFSTPFPGIHIRDRLGKGPQVSGEVLDAVLSSGITTLRGMDRFASIPTVIGSTASDSKKWLRLLDFQCTHSWGQRPSSRSIRSRAHPFLPNFVLRQKHRFWDHERICYSESYQSETSHGVLCLSVF